MGTHRLGWRHLAGSSSCCLLCHCAAPSDDEVFIEGERQDQIILCSQKITGKNVRARLDYLGHGGPASGGV
jgi:hypothetical protein